MRVRHHEGHVFLDTGISSDEITELVYRIDTERGLLHSGDAWANPDRYESRLASTLRPGVPDPRALAAALIAAADEADEYREALAARRAAIPGPPSDYQTTGRD